jgi:glycosyltransferase involved in cell wall biosynthesis
MVGRLEPVKGAQYFVRAAGELKRAGADAHFFVAGTGSRESRLRELAMAHGLDDDLVFLGNVSPVEPLLARTDVLVMPSLSEGLPIVALEAMALETPVVGSGAGGISEVVEDGRTGLLVEPQDVAALVASVSDLLADPERASAMGRAGRARVEERFTAEGMVRAYLGLYAELLGGADAR